MKLRTPLTSIRGALGLLSAGLLGNVDPKAQNLLRIASTNTERLIRLINDILDLERMESGRAPLKLRRCSMYELAHEAVDTMSTMADAAGIHIELVSNAPRDSIYFDADSDRILQVLTNLHPSNGWFQFSPVGSTVSVQIDSNPNSLLLEVSGPGTRDSGGQAGGRVRSLPAGGVVGCEQERRHGAGAGDLPQHHPAARNGAIWAQPNQSGPGTTLWVQLSRSARASDAASPGMLETPERGEGLILVCDDDPGIRVVVAEQLRQASATTFSRRCRRGRNDRLGEEAYGPSQPGRENNGSAPESANPRRYLLDLYMPGLQAGEIRNSD